MEEKGQNEQQSEEPGWSFRQEGEQAAPPQAAGSPPRPTPAKPSESVTWTGSEFIHHPKNASWYLALAGAFTVLAGLTYLFTKDIISVVVTVVVGILFAVLAGKKPRELRYRIDEYGITVGDKLYPFTLYKSFMIIDEGEVGTINLLPLKRLIPDLSVHFPPEQEEKILDILNSVLPEEPRTENQIDRLMRKIHF